MATAGNVWAPSIIATAAEQQQEQEEALAAAAAAAAAKAAARRDREDAAASARELSRRAHAADSTELSSMSLRDAVAAAGNVSPLLRSVLQGAPNLCMCIDIRESCQAVHIHPRCLLLRERPWESI